MARTSARKESSRPVVYAALAGNVLVAATKTVAAVWTGSSAMVSEAVHSFVDTGNELLLLYGMHRAARRPDPEHPVGYGRELYFWSFIVALMVFALGAGVSLYEGVLHIRHPEPITDPRASYIVLGLAGLFEVGSWVVSARQFNASRGSQGYYEAFRRSKDPPSFLVFFEDGAAVVGIAIAAAGTFAAVELGQPVYDGVASILIGLLLAGVAALLAQESKSLLIGERADRRLSDSVLGIADGVHGVAHANGVLTFQLAPDQILIALSLEFRDDLRAPEIEAAVVELERRVREAHPEVTTVFVKPQAAGTYREVVRARYGEG
ncbi:MAG TPA: cation diffusion facilitator family transporter, partial [Gemmatimonadales bacterium]|nr:cation diffusion facilitator family transporter [Gemmatimonadales bacterium]